MIEEVADMLILEAREDQKKKQLIGSTVLKFIKQNRDQKDQERQEDIDTKTAANKELKQLQSFKNFLTMHNQPN